jgi:hypothetical protein
MPHDVIDRRVKQRTPRKMYRKRTTIGIRDWSVQEV